MASAERLSKYNLESLPHLHHTSEFFEIARHVETIADKLPDYTYKRTSMLNYRNSPEVAKYRGEVNLGLYGIVSLYLPDLTGNLPYPQALVFDTPENNAITIGRLRNISDKPEFQLARFHTGRLAELDLRKAMSQASQALEIREIIGGLDNPQKEAYIVYLTREGHLTDWHGAIFENYGINIPYTVTHSEHESANNEFSRVAKTCPTNFEGIVPSKIKTLFISDSTASAMQQIAAIEDVKRHVESSNGGESQLENLVVVSPLLTLYGASVISYWSAKNKLKTTFIASGALLGCNPPDRYYSPVTNHSNLIADPRMIEVSHKAHGQLGGIACARSNWTASFTAPLTAEEKSEKELSMYRSSNDYLKQTSKEVTIEFLESLNIEPAQRLVPYSSFVERAKK